VHFGSDKSRVTAALTRRLGPPSGRGVNAGCGPAFTEIHWGELAVEFHNHTFSGYRDINRPAADLRLQPENTVKPVQPAARTAAGIELGSSLGELRSAYPSLSLAGANRWRAPNGLSFVDNSPRSPGSSQAIIIEIRVGTCGNY
jgi:hypothetical protein